MSQDKRALAIAEAAAFGYTEDQLKRLPLYDIENIIKTQKHRQGRKEPGLFPTELPEPQPQTPEDVIDDNRTVIDLKFAQSANPSDAKYKRFMQLHAIKLQLLLGIAENTKLLQEYRTSFDADDVVCLEGSIGQQQQQLRSVADEMRDIFEWFRTVLSERDRVYTEVAKKTIDPSNQVKSHFQRKLDNIQEYIRVMQQQIESN